MIWDAGEDRLLLSAWSGMRPLADVVAELEHQGRTLREILGRLDYLVGISQ